MFCQYCNRPAKTNVSNAQHELYCKNNPEAKRKIPSYGMLGKKGSNQHIKGTAVPISEETREKLKQHTTQWNTLYWTEENKKKHAKIMQKVAKENPKAYSNPITRGRVKCFTYDGIRFQGNWELEFYKWAKSKGYDVVRATEGFPYIWNGNRTYYPDFFIESLSLYVEVKGYKTDRDDAKWKQFPKKLLVVDKNSIDRIKKDCYTIELK